MHDTSHVQVGHGGIQGFGNGLDRRLGVRLACIEIPAAAQFQHHVHAIFVVVRFNGTNNVGMIEGFQNGHLVLVVCVIATASTEKLM